MRVGVLPTCISTTSLGSTPQCLSTMRVTISDTEPNRLMAIFFPLSSCGLRIPLWSHDRTIKPVNRNADDLEIDARESRLDLRRKIRSGELNAAGHHRLVHERAAADVDTLRVEPMFFKDQLVAHNLEQIVGNPHPAVADLHRSQLF